MNDRHRPLLLPLFALALSGPLACGGPDPADDSDGAAATVVGRALGQSGAAAIRINDLDVVRALVVAELSGLRWMDFEDQSAWSHRGDCNDRELEFIDIALHLPIDDLGALDLRVASASANTIRVEFDMPSAYATGTARYSRTRHNDGCWQWSESKVATARGTVSGFSGALEFSLEEIGGEIEVDQIADLDLHFGDIDIETTSTNDLEAFALDAITWLGGWDVLANTAVGIASDLGFVKRLVERAVDRSMDIVAAVTQVVSTPAGTQPMTITGALDDFDATGDSFDIELDYAMNVTTPASCASGLRLAASDALPRPSARSHDIDVRIPRAAIGQAMYVFAQTGSLCFVFSAGGSLVRGNPSGVLSVSAGPTLAGNRGIRLRVPYALARANGAAAGSAVVDFDVFVSVDDAGRLVVESISAPTIASLSGSLPGPGKASINLANHQGDAQAALDAKWPPGGLAFPILPGVLPVGRAGYALVVAAVTHVDEWLTIGLALGSASTPPPPGGESCYDCYDGGIPGLQPADLERAFGDADDADRAGGDTADFGLPGEDVSVQGL